MKQSKIVSAVSPSLAICLGGAACSSDDTSSEPSPKTDAAQVEGEQQSSMGSNDSKQLGTIPEVAAEAGAFTILIDAVTAAGLAETLSGGEYTVFAPSNAAFQPFLDDGTVEKLLEDPDGQLKDILLYHVVGGKVTAEDIVKPDGQDVKTVQAETLKVNVTNDEKITITDGAGNAIKVVAADVEASNGVIHAIDGVLLPAG